VNHLLSSQPLNGILIEGFNFSVGDFHRRAHCLAFREISSYQHQGNDLMSFDVLNFQENLHSLLATRSSAPFLFIGSGFSRRYIGLENWDGLLAKFCITGKPYNFYKSSANQDTPLAAKLLSNDYYEAWWANEEFSLDRELHGNEIIDKTSPLRMAISNYLKKSSNTKNIPDSLAGEIELLKKCDIDGIITTNWDMLLESLFPNYRVFVGQRELLFSNPMSVAEIYKIHGCCTRPTSLVLTDDDYHDYNEKNAYLASKLITIFVENPIIFIGYSLTDANIRSLIKSIASCIGGDDITKLQDNLIFVDRKQSEHGPSIETAYLQFEDSQIPVKLIKSSDFSPIYEALSKFQRKLPARVLRFCKERIFELVKDSTADKKIAVIDFESIQDIDSVEVVFGLGVLGKIGEQGYSAITVEDLFEDLIMENKRYTPNKILNITFNDLPVQTKFAPIYKYLRSAGINNRADYNNSGLTLNKFLRERKEDFLKPPQNGLKKYHGYSLEEFLRSATESEIVSILPFFPNLTHQELGNYLVENFEEITVPRYKYHYRKIMAFYDWLKYGF